MIWDKSLWAKLCIFVFCLCCLSFGSLHGAEGFRERFGAWFKEQVIPRVQEKAERFKSFRQERLNPALKRGKKSYDQWNKEKFQPWMNQDFKPWVREKGTKIQAWSKEQAVPWVREKSARLRKVYRGEIQPRVQNITDRLNHKLEDADHKLAARLRDGWESKIDPQETWTEEIAEEFRNPHRVGRLVLEYQRNPAAGTAMMVGYMPVYNPVTKKLSTFNEMARDVVAEKKVFEGSAWQVDPVRTLVMVKFLNPDTLYSQKLLKIGGRWTSLEEMLAAPKNGVRNVFAQELQQVHQTAVIAFREKKYDQFEESMDGFTKLVMEINSQQDLEIRSHSKFSSIHSKEDMGSKFYMDGAVFGPVALVEEDFLDRKAFLRRVLKEEGRTSEEHVVNKLPLVLFDQARSALLARDFTSFVTVKRELNRILTQQQVAKKDQANQYLVRVLKEVHKSGLLEKLSQAKSDPEFELALDGVVDNIFEKVQNLEGFRQWIESNN
jgi:hypothetical protein